ncbi:MULTISPECIES: biotin transporter BioY [Sphaerochaeta]|jgi:biotin transport system substrate-specific component|uniref:Biotin transporter BioY n=1 Tax=bioreactor metagenome TaxID=1076179 RepID=A0A644XTL0_9ZZZZ|nr:MULTISPECIES: biotin transporter BioY [Sphaerochaeta]MDT3359935.1 biotin transporter BioY [Spirochaetota bacterium]MDD3422936.1 biotin transporter BioY [Sphaerochaeta sp.]MDD3456288.1 biotin transporter BioY [Sphaerochaeta sp.]MDD4036955.1 biotin transporter BioY [Sphaerochaeta sp.]MDD4450258.1 biotin transporter BioY [Sphaerochaeta sp.]
MHYKRLLLTSLFSALIIIGAYLRFPLPPVPITLQTLFVLLAGFLGGTRMALSSTAIYLLLGAVGLPVFSSGGGLGNLIGPTGGFLIALLPAACIAGIAGNFPAKAEKPRTYLALCLGFGLIATLVIYLVGVPFLKYNRSLSWGIAIQAGMLPFLIGDVIKLLVASQLARSFQPRISQLLG